MVATLKTKPASEQIDVRDICTESSFRHTILLMKLDECTVATLKMKTHVKVDGQTFRIYAQNLVPDT